MSLSAYDIPNQLAKVMLIRTLMKLGNVWPHILPWLAQILSHPEEGIGVALFLHTAEKPNSIRKIAELIVQQDLDIQGLEVLSDLVKNYATTAQQALNGSEEWHTFDENFREVEAYRAAWHIARLALSIAKNDTEEEKVRLLLLALHSIIAADQGAVIPSEKDHQKTKAHGEEFCAFLSELLVTLVQKPPTTTAE